MRCSRARLHHPALLGFGILVAVLVASGRVEAINPVFSKLHGRPPVSHAEDYFGWSVAINEAWIVIGAFSDDESGDMAGAVFVYNSVTGSFVRKLRPPGLAAGSRFGSALSLCGNQVLVGAPGSDGNKGRAYLFNLTTGAVVMDFFDVSGVAGDGYGESVALSAKFAAVGVPNSTGYRGAAFVYRLASLSDSIRIPPPVAESAGFGASVALTGNVIVVGAPDADGSAANVGAAYVCNALTGDLIRTLPSPVSVNGRMGGRLAVSGGKVLVGSSHSAWAAVLFDLDTGSLLRSFSVPARSPSDLSDPPFPVGLQGSLAVIGAHTDPEGSLGNIGATYLCDTNSGAIVRKIIAPDGHRSQYFGQSVSISGSFLVIGAPGDDDLGNLAGAAYFVAPLSLPLPLRTVAKIGDFAPDAPDTRFRVFGPAHLNSEGEVMLQAGLNGSGSNAGTDTAVWSTLENPLFLDVALKSRQALSGTLHGQSYDGVRVGALFAPILHRNETGLFQCTLTGAGVATANNRALFREDGGPVVTILRTDRAITTSASGPSWNGARVGSMLRVAEAAVNDNLVVSCTLRPGLAGTSATSDTGILVLDHDGSVQNTFYREGQPTPEDDTFGQFMGTTAAGPTLWFAYRAFTLPGAKQAVFYGSYGGRGERLGLQDAPLDGELAGTRFTSFAGESLQEGTTYWRASLAGTGVTTLNNQVLMREGEGVVVRTGHEIEPGLFVSRIEKYWALNAGYVVMQVILRGTGVTAANNRALYLRWVDGGGDVYMRLLRTGESPDGCGAARIGALQQVVAEPSGRYAILASLAGAPLNANQALFMGNARAGDNTMARRVLRQPFMRLRKGTSYQAVHGQSARILSISITNTTDTDGVGNKGMGQVINPAGQLVLNILFSDSAREIMIGAP